MSNLVKITEAEVRDACPANLRQYWHIFRQLIWTEHAAKYAGDAYYMDADRLEHFKTDIVKPFIILVGQCYPNGDPSKPTLSGYVSFTKFMSDVKGTCLSHAILAVFVNGRPYRSKVVDILIAFEDTEIDQAFEDMLSSYAWSAR